jgi:hypothetical protein
MENPSEISLHKRSTGSFAPTSRRHRRRSQREFVATESTRLPTATVRQERGVLKLLPVQVRLILKSHPSKRERQRAEEIRGNLFDLNFDACAKCRPGDLCLVVIHEMKGIRVRGKGRLLCSKCHNLQERERTAPARQAAQVSIEQDACRLAEICQKDGVVLSSEQYEIVLTRCCSPWSVESIAQKLLKARLRVLKLAVCGSCYRRGEVALKAQGVMHLSGGVITSRCDSCHSRTEAERALRNVAKTVLRNPRRRAQSKGLPFELTEKDMLSAFERAGASPEAPHGLCEALGIPLTVGKQDVVQPSSLTIHQIHPGLGYLRGGFALLCMEANTAIGAHPHWRLECAYLYVQAGGAQYTELNRSDAARDWTVRAYKDVVRSVHNDYGRPIISRDAIITPTRCSSCGTTLCYGPKGVRQDNSPSLDRLDPHRGYEPGNVFTICWPCNSCKYTLDEPKFYRLLCWDRRQRSCVDLPRHSQRLTIRTPASPWHDPGPPGLIVCGSSYDSSDSHGLAIPSAHLI